MGALKAVREAVEIHRRLAKASPARFEPDLAKSLGTLGVVYRSNGKHADAIKALKEGTDLIRPYALKLPGSPFEALLKRLEDDLKRT